MVGMPFQNVEKYLGLCPKPHLRAFFEKKALKNPQKTLKMV